jgi:outer membrane biogenesis lipoprotein LolB
MRMILIAVAAALLAGCATTAAPVNRPCGVIVDSLVDVQGAARTDQQRIDRHHARGRGAGCW